MLSSNYPYNSLILPIIAGNSDHNKNKYQHNKGFMPIKRTFSGLVQTIDYTKEKVLDSTKINVFKLFLSDCMNMNIQLHIVCPPYMIHAIGKDSSITIAKKIAHDFSIDFVDYSSDTFFTSKPELFADFRHLNEMGVEIFSKNVAQSISSSKY